MVHDICYPTLKTWFVINADVMGVVLPQQCMMSGATGTLETFTDAALFVARLIELEYKPSSYTVAQLEADF